MNDYVCCTVDIAPIALPAINVVEIIPLQNEQGSMIGFGGTSSTSTSAERLQRGHQRVIDSARYSIETMGNICRAKHIIA